MKNIVVIFLILVGFQGCSAIFMSLGNAYLARNFFLVGGDLSKHEFFSRCSFVSKDAISPILLHKFKNCDEFVGQCSKFENGFYDKFGNALNDTIQDGAQTTLPVESCDKTWCKIYYPCGEMEYFVKKDEIEPYVKKAK